MSIDEAVALINGLPHPVTAACFLESLDRPLLLEATSSINSVQPADGARSPRIFIFSDPLVMSLVPSGTGADVIEFSELQMDESSVKAEVQLPVTGTITVEAVFARIMFNATMTSCAICHPHETVARSAGSAMAYTSRAFRPVDTTLVPLTSLQAEHDACDAAIEPERCAFYVALFAHGAVREQRFLDPFPTQFETAD